MKETFTTVVWKEGGWYVAQCREFEVASQGKTREEALNDLSEAIKIHLSPPVATLPPGRNSHRSRGQKRRRLGLSLIEP